MAYIGHPVAGDEAPRPRKTCAYTLRMRTLGLLTRTGEVLELQLKC